jgi:hypothetical protein
VSLSAFAYLYLELVQYHQHRVASISELERKLEASGYGVGLKVLELLAYRSKEVSIFCCEHKKITGFESSRESHNVSSLFTYCDCYTIF